MEIEVRNQIPRLLTIRQVAATGILPEHALRSMVKQGQIPVLKVGNRNLINMNTLVLYLNSATGVS